MKHKFQSEGRWEVVDIGAKIRTGIQYRRVGAKKSNSREEKRQNNL